MGREVEVEEEQTRGGGEEGCGESEEAWRGRRRGRESGAEARTGDACPPSPALFFPLGLSRPILPSL